MSTEEKEPNVNANDSSHVIVSFPVQGKQLPADHGYSLYAAVTKYVSSLHGVTWLGIELISGVPWDKGVIALTVHNASLRLRIPADKFFQVLPLAGARLKIDGYALRLGIPTVRPIILASALYARIVTIKKFTEPELFLAAAHRQLTQLGITGTLALPHDGRTRSRRIITIHGRKVVGFSLAVHDLSDEDSIKLQSVGLGGRRAMGCGIFNPIVKKLWNQEESASEAI